MSSIKLYEGSAPNAPGSGIQLLYARSDGVLAYKNGSGEEILIKDANALQTVAIGSGTDSAGDNVGLDSSGGSFTRTLPDPTNFTGNKQVTYIDLGEAVSTNNITIDGNGNNIKAVGQSATTQHTIDTNGAKVEFVWDGSVWHVRYIANTGMDPMLAALIFG